MPDFKFVILVILTYESLIAQSVEQRTWIFSRKFFVSSRLTGGIFGVGNFILDLWRYGNHIHEKSHWNLQENVAKF